MRAISATRITAGYFFLPPFFWTGSTYVCRTPPAGFGLAVTQTAHLGHCAIDARCDAWLTYAIEFLPKVTRNAIRAASVGAPSKSGGRGIGEEGLGSGALRGSAVRDPLRDNAVYSTHQR